MTARERTYYTYIMASSSRALYIGVTNDLERRVQQHKDNELGGFTAKYRCHRLVWFERYSWIGQAIAREKELKGWLRAKKIALIQQINPTWIDLSEEWGAKIFSAKLNKSRSFAMLRMTAGGSIACWLRMTILREKDIRFAVILNEAQRSEGSAFF